MFINEFVAYAELGKAINFRNEIIEKNLFDSYRNGTISLPSNGIIWNVNYFYYFTSIVFITYTKI
jgi:hypothetical protein